MPERHALLGASDASRWLNCPPSVRLTENITEQPSEFAEEGTTAHTLAELKLRAIYYGEDTKPEQARLKQSPYYSKSMDDYVGDFVNVVAEAWAEALNAVEFDKAQGIRITTPPAIYFELVVDTSKWVPEGYGTSDVVIVAGDHVHIIDLKYGKGRPVSAQENPQLRLYALGAVYTLKVAPWAHTKMTICQPRLGNTETVGANAFDLLRWAKRIVRPAAKKAFLGEGDKAAGRWCQWCPIKAQCRTRANYLLEGMNEAPPEWLTGKELGNILARASELESWLKAVGKYAVDRAMQGEKIEGFKLIEGKRGRRQIVDPDSAEAELIFGGYDESLFMTAPKLKGITELENQLGRKAFQDLLGPYIEQPAGGIKLAPESDRAPEWTPFDGDMFGDLEEENTK